MKNIKIYVVTHKKYKIYKDEIYIPISVGDNNLPYLSDREGDNISNKNESFCELTALYWIWKNSNYDVVGLNHYRRYFKGNKIINQEEIEYILKRKDIIIPSPYNTRLLTVEQQYSSCHYKEDYNKCRELMYTMYPEYKESFEKISKRHYLYNCNMLICNKKLLNEYSNWLFPILFELEKIIDTSDYNSYNKRVIGFLAERLFNVWLEKNNKLKIKTKKIISI